MKKLNLNELFVGACVGLVSWIWLGPWSILVSLGTSIMWALGGAYGHSKRVFGVPAVMCLAMFIKKHTLVAIYPYIPMALVLSIGYGIPSIYPPDEGSALGKFWFYKLKQNEFLANVFTRGTIYILLFISMSLWFIK